MTDLEGRLKRVVRIAWILGAVGAIVGMFPGKRIYDDASNCLGAALSDWAGEGASHACVSDYTQLVAERRAAGIPMVLFVGVVAAYGWMLLRQPGRRMAIGWSLWTVVALVVYVVATFDLDLFSHTVILWAEPVTYTLIGAMLVVVIPITLTIAMVSRPTPRDELVARAVVR